LKIGALLLNDQRNNLCFGW